MARRADPDFKVYSLDEPMPDPKGRQRNGCYRGSAPVRELPPGVTGADLSRARKITLAVGQIWRRGPQRVRVTRITNLSVTFHELSHGSAVRTHPRWLFLRFAIPERALGDDGGDE